MTLSVFLKEKSQFQENCTVYQIVHINVSKMKLKFVQPHVRAKVNFT